MLQNELRSDLFASVILACALVLSLATTGFAAAGSQVVATVGDHKITEQEVDAKIQPQMAAIESKIYDMKHQAIQEMADDYLFEQAAKKAGLTTDQYIQKEITAKAGVVTDTEAKAFYDQNKARIPASMTYESLKPRIALLLNQQKQQAQKEKVLDALRAEQPITILLTAPRMQVASAGHPQLGPDSAPVTVVEFADFQCPFCGKSEPTVKQVRERYGDKVKLVYMDFPLPMHNNALGAAKAARCANEQGKFWPYHDLLFANQTKLSPADLKGYAKNLQLDTTKFDACFDQAKFEADVRKDMAEGQKLGVDGTPSFYIDGRPLIGAQPESAFSSIIDEELASGGKPKKQKTASAQ